MKIEKPGIFFGVSEADYRSDPCPSPSLTQSLCKILIERSPHHAWTECPRLNPHFEYDDDTKFDLGNIAHRLILGRGKEIEVLQYADWRTKASQEAREEAADAGKIAVLQKDFERASDMTSAALLQLRKHEDKDAFTNGAGEVMICWQEDGIWFRSLIDWLHGDLRTVDDYKSTAKSIAPHAIGMVAQSAGWEVQAAFIERGLDVLDPAGRGRRRFRFIAQETDKPHALTVMHMSEAWMTMGRKKAQWGISSWEVCSRLSKWPSYPSRSIVPEYPGFKEAQWLEREQAAEIDPDTKLIMAG